MKIRVCGKGALVNRKVIVEFQAVWSVNYNDQLDPEIFLKSICNLSVDIGMLLV